MEMSQGPQRTEVTGRDSECPCRGTVFTGMPGFPRGQRESLRGLGVYQESLRGLGASEGWAPQRVGHPSGEPQRVGRQEEEEHLLLHGAHRLVGLREGVPA